MKFEKILPALREGKKVRREYWESYRKYMCMYFEMSNDCFKLRVLRNNSEDDETWNCVPIADLIMDDWEIVKETKKVKLRDLTEKQFNKWKSSKCHSADFRCSDCPFNKVVCREEIKGGNYSVSCKSSYWMNNKDLYNDKFLDQEIEIEE